MHFHPAMVELMRHRHGADTVRLLKPSPGKEAYLGFDQGWAHAAPTTVDLLGEIEAFLNTGGPQPTIYLAYFLQFKTVDEMVRKSSFKPAGFVLPYFRSELRMKASKRARYSQHELLVRLCKIPTAKVYYACGMMFSVDEVWDAPDLNKLRMVDVRSAPVLGAGRHFLCFRKKDSDGDWCSEPVPASSISAQEWAMRQLELLTPLELLEQLEGVVSNIRRLGSRPLTAGDLTIQARIQRLRNLWPKSRVPRSFNVVRFGQQSFEEERHLWSR
jgi:hypothetical protein